MAFTIHEMVQNFNVTRWSSFFLFLNKDPKLTLIMYQSSNDFTRIAVYAKYYQLTFLFEKITNCGIPLHGVQEIVLEVKLA